MNSDKKRLTHHADTEGVLALLDGYISSAMLIAAMEHGLFWLLEKRSRTPEEIAETLNLPLGRCRYWLQYLSTLGFITLESGKYSLTGKSRSGITDAFSQNTWSLLAGEARERFPPFQYFSPYLADPDSIWRWTGLEPPEYVQQMKADPARARRFTQMLYEIHQDLANGIAQQLNLTGVDRIMDLGGGSGVVTIALLKQYPDVEALIVDIPNVCDAGAEIVEAEGLSDRVQFLPADFLHDNLPVDFPLILECDVGVYNEIIFEKVRASLRPDGRYIILDQFSPSSGLAPQSRLTWAVQGSLRDPDFQYKTADEIAEMLGHSGFSKISVQPFLVSSSMGRRFTDDMFIIEARI
jgi:SAM-dependent methyltransferase